MPILETYTQPRTWNITWTHCSLPDNEAADVLAEEGGILPQIDTSMTYEEAKSVIKIAFKINWVKEQKNDIYNQLSREQQVIILFVCFGSTWTEISTFSKGSWSARLNECMWHQQDDKTYSARVLIIWGAEKTRGQHIHQFKRSCMLDIHQHQLTANYFRMIQVDIWEWLKKTCM